MCHVSSEAVALISRSSAAAKMSSSRMALVGCGTLQLERIERMPAAANATNAIRLKLLKIGALIRISVRRVRIAMASACPAADEWARAARCLDSAAKARAAPV
jgi:hypothetical protein